MCNLSQGIHEEGYAEGKIIGMTEGKVIGMTEGKYDSMINLMDSLQIGFTDTLKLLKIPHDEWALYEDLYRKKNS